MSRYKIGNIIDEKYYLESILEETELVSTYQIWHGNWEISLVGKIINYRPDNEEKRSSLLKKASQWIELGVHPNIISAYFLREIEDNLILISESIPNKNLLELKKHIRENILEILALALEIANGISYLHKKGIIHNTLCMENILVDKYGRIRINNICWNQWEGLEKISKGQRCDFYNKFEKDQLAKIRKKIIRKLVYQDPEYFIKKDYSPSILNDIYGFGIILYELITDDFPILLEDDTENLYLECKTKYESNSSKYFNSESFPDISAELCKLINDCINKDSNNRPSSFNEIIGVLQKIYKEKTEKYYIFEEFPHNITLAMTLNNRALGYIDKKKYIEAEKILREAIDLDISNITAPMNYYLLKLHQRKITFEDFFYKTTKYALFDDIRLYLLLGKSCLESGSLTCKILDKINDTKFFDNRLELIKGHLNYRLQNYEKAREIYKEQVKINNTQDIWYRLGASLLGLKLNEDAQKSWEQGLGQNIPISDLIVDYTMLLAMQKKWAKARSYLDTAMQNFENYIKYRPSLSTWSQVRNLEASPKSEVIEVAISNDKKYIFANTKDGKYHFWLWPSGEKCHDIDLPSFSSSEITSYSEGFVANRNTTRILRKLLEFNITKIKVSKQNYLGITTHDDSIIRIWDLRKGRCIHELKGHTKVVTAVAISSDGKTAVSGSMDKSIQIWDTEKGLSLGRLKGHEDCITCITMTEDSRYMVSASWDNTIKIWDLQRKKCETTIVTSSTITALAISLNGNILASGDKNNNINIWDINTQKLVASLKGHQKEITCLDISQDDMLIVSSSIDGSISIYENIIKRPCPCWSHANYFLASLPHPVSLEIKHNIKDLEEILDENLGSKNINKVLNTYKNLLKIKKEVIINEFPLSFSKTNQIVDFLHKNKYTRKKLLNYYQVQILIHESPVVFYAVNNNMIYSLSEKGIFKQCLLEKSQNNLFWEKNFLIAKGFDFSSKYKCFVFACNDGLLRSWYPKSDEWQIIEGDPSQLQCIKIFNDTIITGSRNGLLQFWDLKNLKLIDSIQAHEQMIFDLEIIEKENILVSTGIDRKVYCWDIESKKKIKEIQHISNINLCVDVVYGDELYFIIGGVDGTIQQWSASTGLLYSVKKICKAAITSLASIKEQNLVLCGNNNGYLSLWNLEKHICYFSIKAHKDAVNQVSFSSDGEWAFSSSKDNSLIVWKLNWEWESISRPEE